MSNAQKVSDEPISHTFARIAHKAAIRIRPEVSGDAEYWRLREAIHQELNDSSPSLRAAPTPDAHSEVGVLVPQKPTREMLIAANQKVAVVTPDGTWSVSFSEAERVYTVMIEAALASKPEGER